MRVEAAGAGDRAGEAGVAEDDGGRDDALGEQPLLAVQVDQDRVEQLGALGEPDLEPRPGGGVEHERHRVELPRLRPPSGLP